MFLNLDKLKLRKFKTTMEHQMSQNQARGSDLTEISFSQQAQAQAQAQLLSFQPGVEVGRGMLSYETNGSQVEVPNRRKRKGRIPTQTPDEKRKKKIEADRNYRKNLKDEFNKLKATASRVENLEHKINQMEAELHRLRGKEREFHRLEYKFGGIEEMEFKLHRFDQIASMFGGIDEILPEINRLKNIELQHIQHEQMGSRLNQNAQPFIDLPQEDYHGMQFVNFNNQVQGSMINWLEDYEIHEMFPVAESETMPDLVYSDSLVTEFIAKLDDNVMSLYGFNNLQGECQAFGDYTFPGSLMSNVNDNFNDHSDVTGNCVLSTNFLENIDVLFWSAINEMDGMFLEQVDEKIILNWRDRIKDAMLIGYDAKFAMDHLKKIACAYFGLKARNDQSIVEKRIADLTAEEKSLRAELEKKVNAMHAKIEELTSPLCKMCQNFADEFLNKTVCLF